MVNSPTLARNRERRKEKRERGGGGGRIMRIVFQVQKNTSPIRKKGEEKEEKRDALGISAGGAADDYS